MEQHTRDSSNEPTGPEHTKASLLPDQASHLFTSIIFGISCTTIAPSRLRAIALRPTRRTMDEKKHLLECEDCATLMHELIWHPSAQQTCARVFETHYKYITGGAYVPDVIDAHLNTSMCEFCNAWFNFLKHSPKVKSLVERAASTDDDSSKNLWMGVQASLSQADISDVLAVSSVGIPITVAFGGINDYVSAVDDVTLEADEFEADILALDDAGDEHASRLHGELVPSSEQKYYLTLHSAAPRHQEQVLRICIVTEDGNELQSTFVAMHGSQNSIEGRIEFSLPTAVEPIRVLVFGVRSEDLLDDADRQEALRAFRWTGEHNPAALSCWSAWRPALDAVIDVPTPPLPPTETASTEHDKPSPSGGVGVPEEQGSGEYGEVSTSMSTVPHPGIAPLPLQEDSIHKNTHAGYKKSNGFASLFALIALLIVTCVICWKTRCGVEKSLLPGEMASSAAKSTRVNSMPVTVMARSDLDTQQAQNRLSDPQHTIARLTSHRPNVVPIAAHSFIRKTAGITKTHPLVMAPSVRWNRHGSVPIVSTSGRRRSIDRRNMIGTLPISTARGLASRHGGASRNITRSRSPLVVYFAGHGRSDVSIQHTEEQQLSDATKALTTALAHDYGDGERMASTEQAACLLVTTNNGTQREPQLVFTPRQGATYYRITVVAACDPADPTKRYESDPIALTTLKTVQHLLPYDLEAPSRTALVWTPSPAIRARFEALRDLPDNRLCGKVWAMTEQGDNLRDMDEAQGPNGDNSVVFRLLKPAAIMSLIREEKAALSIAAKLRLRLKYRLYDEALELTHNKLYNGQTSAAGHDNLELYKEVPQVTTQKRE